MHQLYVRGAVFALRYFAVSFIVAGIAVVATIMVSPHVLARYVNRGWLIVVILYVFAAIAFVAPLWAWRERILQA